MLAANAVTGTLIAKTSASVALDLGTVTRIAVAHADRGQRVEVLLAISHPEISERPAGATWSDASNGLPEVPFNVVDVDRRNRETLYSYGHRRFSQRLPMDD